MHLDQLGLDVRMLGKAEMEALIRLIFMAAIIGSAARAASPSYQVSMIETHLTAILRSLVRSGLRASS